MRVARNITLGPVYDEEICLKQKCHPSIYFILFIYLFHYFATHNELQAE